jgi:outer membrane protein OmpA-like peptidoglycan-associated protein
MKRLFKTSLMFCIAAIQIHAQIIDPKQAAEEAGTNHVNNTINSEVNDAANQLENGVKGLFKKKNKTKADPVATKTNNNAATSTTSSSVTTSSSHLNDYGKYDFVPGDTVLFEDNVQDEQADEIPSKWKILSGRVEVRNREDEKAIVMVDGWNVAITPRLKTMKILPQRFTLEFDAMTTGTDAAGSGWPIEIVWEGGSGNMVNNLKLMQNGHVYLGEQAGEYPIPEEIAENKWYHVAIAVSETSMKVYINKYRVLNAQTENGRANSFKFSIVGISTDGLNQRYFKNVRLAAGGVDPYKQVTTSGKFIARGIKFDYNKATTKPESMGEINRITSLMKDHPELKFEIGGHTDNDGDDAYNLKLSQQRADAVKTQLVAQGIDATRFTTKGYGSTKPMADNATPEGKANNRRVEFTKQ